ncbi:MAG: hypothetical protein PWP27_2173 [Clostridiales bacterium]|nr:hypothetical protein [Clostridiales bacterium]
MIESVFSEIQKFLLQKNRLCKLMIHTLSLEKEIHEVLYQELHKKYTSNLFQSYT